MVMVLFLFLALEILVEFQFLLPEPLEAWICSLLDGGGNHVDLPVLFLLQEAEPFVQPWHQHMGDEVVKENAEDYDE